MTSSNEDRADEERLSKLFEESAQRPSEVQRARLLARASEVAERNSTRRVGVRFVWPAAVMAAAAVAYLVVAAPRRERTSSVPAPARASSSGMLAVATPALARSSMDPTTKVVDSESDLDDPAASVLGGEPGEGDPLDLGPLMAPDDGEGGGG